MQCVNHPELEAKAFCQNCGKALCADCVRTTASGQLFCEQCHAGNVAAGGDPNQAPNQVPGQAYWQGQVPPFYAMPPRNTPNPGTAAVLGLIPGVGAMYNGQLFKGLIHVVIFAVLVSLAENYGVFGIFIGAWVLYQSFEAFHTAKARRDGTPLPDPFGLNEVGSWLNWSGTGRGQNVPPPPPPPPPVGGATYDPPQGASASYAAGSVPPPYTAPYTSSWSDPATPGAPQPPYTESYTAPFTESYQNYPPGYVPPMPPIPPPPPFTWRRREPVWAVVLIILGVVFLLKSLGFVSHLFHFAWPVMLIGLGVWLIISRLGYVRGGSK